MGEENLGNLDDGWVTQANGKRAMAVTGGGQPLDVSRQSNISPWNDFYFVQANGSPTALAAAVPDPSLSPSRLLTVNSIANISIGDWLGVFSGTEGSERYYWAEVMDINGLVLTMQALIDYPFDVGSTVISTTKNMAVDGSVTPQVFSIQAGGGSGDLAIDISRVMMACLTLDTVDLSTFGDIAGGLIYGIYLRVKENGVYRNKMIAKTNFDLAKFAYDWQPFAKSRPNEGQDGFNWRFSLGGEDKHDSFSRVEGGNIGTLQWVIQDDLTTLVLLESVGANSEVTP